MRSIQRGQVSRCQPHTSDGVVHSHHLQGRLPGSVQRLAPRSAPAPALQWAATQRPPLLRMQLTTSAAPEPAGAGVTQQEARSKVLDLLKLGFDNYNPGEQLGPAVQELLLHNPTPEPGAQTIPLGQGTWEVFYAPHIANMSNTLGTRFSPIRYTLSDGTRLVSNVQFSSSITGQGWLSSSGTLAAPSSDTVQVAFSKFWIDLGADALRPELLDNGAPASSTFLGFAVDMDAAIGAIGRAAFFPQFATFPVLYLDADLAVFKFPPLNSIIAVHRLSPHPIALLQEPRDS